MSDKLISYRHKDDPTYIYIGLASETPPKWAVDIKPYTEPKAIDVSDEITSLRTQLADATRKLEQVCDYKPKLHAASYQHNGIDYAITLEGCNEEVHAHAMRLGMAIDGNIVHQEMLSPPSQP
jgi:hypothetical protein